MTDALKTRVAGIIAEMRTLPTSSGQHHMLVGWVCGVATVLDMHTCELLKLVEPMVEEEQPGTTWVVQ